LLLIYCLFNDAPNSLDYTHLDPKHRLCQRVVGGTTTEQFVLVVRVRSGQPAKCREKLKILQTSGQTLNPELTEHAAGYDYCTATVRTVHCESTAKTSVFVPWVRADRQWVRCLWVRADHHWVRCLWVRADRQWVRCLCRSSVCLVSKLNLHVLAIDLAPTCTVLCPLTVLEGSFQAVIAHSCYSTASLPVFVMAENAALSIHLCYS
jgi:hypothetical protein